MERAHVMDQLWALFEDELLVQRERVELSTRLREDLRLDSLALLTLVVEVENRFEICFESGEEESVRTAGDLVEAIVRAQRRAASAGPVS